MKEQIVNLLPPGHPWGQHLIWLEETESTNLYARNLAKNGAPHGTTVIAGHQTGGRGRLGRHFSSPAGMGVYFSVILRPNCRPEQLMHLTCAAGVAAARAVKLAANLAPGIKWTNDLVCGKRKLGGILTELSISPETGLTDWAIIGIGINCLQSPSDFPPELQNMACSIKTETGIALPPAKLAACLMETLSNMDVRLLTNREAILAEFRANCVTLGQEISILQGDSVRHGTAVDIDAKGGLITRFADGHTETISSGEVSIRGMYGYL